MLVLGAASALLTPCGIEPALPDGRPDPGLILAADAEAATADFIAAIAKHRHFARETDPPRV
jgi:catalase